MSCRSCGQPITDDARFCPQCGASQHVGVEERRVVTVLFADLVGFTSLAERRDPEEVKHLVDRAFDRVVSDITSFGGVIDKIMGDGIVALFGAPVAHEDDAERAVRAGLKMHLSLDALSVELHPRATLRIGINTGEVLVGTASGGGDYTAMGDVVNSASRLQGLAEPGQTLVGGATRLATGEAIAYQSAGQLPAKGRDEPIEAWVALSAIHPPGFHHQRGATFVGRRNEIDLLAAQSRLAFDDSRAQLSVVIGETGIGKGRLVSEIAARVEEHSGAAILEGRCLPYGEANVWWPVAELLRDLLDIPIDGAMPEAEEIAAKSVAAHLDHPSEGEIERYTTSVLHAFGYDTSLRAGDRNRNRSEVMLAFTAVLEAELARRPVLLILSDMHWASPAVWGLVGNAMSELVRSQLVVLMTTRPTDLSELPNGRHGLSLIQLGPLDVAASAELLVELGIDRDDQHIGDLVDRSGGNPYFLEELAGLVTKHEPSPGTPREDFDVDLDQLPATLRGTVSARLDALDQAERAVLEDASVLGRTGSVQALSLLAVEVRGETNIEAALMSLVEEDLLEIEGARFRFRSNLVRDVAYGRLTKTVRAQQHLGIAQYLEDAQGSSVRNSVVVAIAEHYRAAAQLSLELPSVVGVDHAVVVDRALYWLEQAGDRALDVGEPKQAARWYDFGVDLATNDETLCHFVFGRARARTELHDLAGAMADLERLSTLSDLEPEASARALLVRGDVNRKAGNMTLAVADLGEAAERMQELGLADQQALALRLLGMTAMSQSEDASARQALEASRSVAMVAGDRRSEGWALQTLAWHAFLLGRVSEARDLVNEAIEIFTEVEDNGALVWAKGVLAWVAFHTGHWDESRTLIDAVLPETRRRGDPWAEAIILNLDASLQLWSGHAERAKELARQARVVAEGINEVTLAVMARAAEGRALVSLGRIDEGNGALDDAFSAADQADDEDGRRLAVVASCASAARLGEPERAIRWAARHHGAIDDPSIVGESDLAVSLALAMLQRRAVDEAATQLDWIERSDGPDHFAEAVGSIITAAAGDLDRSEQYTARTLAGRSTYLDRAFALLSRAVVRARLKDSAGCDEALAAAEAEVAPTDDQPTRLLIDLVAAICGRASLDEAKARMRSSGMDPAGWLIAYGLATGHSRRAEILDN
ncbi:MAG: AAA family ATPase [Actinomycetia bacterium]|nr:AAA family ATPase [Actinomycetes bacterium]MCP4223570.1 AAA family ATPase [Actinomycetes bacterium]MCP5035405.1 AAA family ATPase [Actinomycetes bacterium]